MNSDKSEVKVISICEILSFLYPSIETVRPQLHVKPHLLLPLPTGCPKISEVTEKDVESYSSYSVPVTTRAKYNHAQELRLLQQPWWKKLGDEYQDEKMDEELNWKVF